MSTAELIEALERACGLLDRSEESAWSPLTPAQVAKNLRRVIEALGRGDALDRLALGTEFAPTSTIQEIAMTNGWHDEYMRLAEIVDANVGRLDQ